MRRTMIAAMLVFLAVTTVAQESQGGFGGRSATQAELILVGSWERVASQGVDWLKTAGGRSQVIGSRGRSEEAVEWTFNPDGSLLRGEGVQGVEAELWSIVPAGGLRIVDALGRTLDYALLFASNEMIVLTRAARDASDEYATFTESQVFLRK